MKKIIKNKLYDTEAAQKVGSYSNGYGCWDFNYVSEALYRTKSGAWFLHAQGGARTEYKTVHGDSQSSGETIIPLSDERALEWLSRNDLVEAAEKFFPGDIEEA
jgi:hypothetical protein